MKMVVDEAYATGVMFLARVVEALRGRQLIARLSELSQLRISIDDVVLSARPNVCEEVDSDGEDGRMISVSHGVTRRRVESTIQNLDRLHRFFG